MANDGFMKGGLVTALGTWLKQTFAYKSHTHAGSEITSGTLDINRIPNLTADKTTSGTFSTSRIPSLDASKITSGTFDTARIPTNISITGNANTATTSTRTQKAETWKNDKSGTYGASYPIYAWWKDGSNVIWKCDNYTTWTDKATTAASATNADYSNYAYNLYEEASGNECNFEFNEAGGSSGEDMFDIVASSGYSRIERAKGIDTGRHWVAEENSAGDFVFTYE